MDTLRRVSYAIIVPILIIIGICGNILHLITLRSKTLRSVPFMYIRAIAVFDLAALCCAIVFCLSLTTNVFSGDYPVHYLAAFYLAHVQPPLVNLLLTASIFTALVLTVERYRSASISQLYQLRAIQYMQKIKAKCYIFASFFISFLLHTLMAFENVVVCHPEDAYMNCTVDFETEYFISHKFKFYYNWTREVLCRMVPVLLLAVLNLILVKKLHDIKRRRHIITLKHANLNQLDRARSSINSYTEKRLTTVMMVITLVYIIGNVPQSVSMVLTDESREDNYQFQIFRAFSNIMEIGNHCINFYIFCLSSQDYLRTFIRRFRRLQSQILIYFCRQKQRKESFDSQSTLVPSLGERSIFLTDAEDDLVPL